MDKGRERFVVAAGAEARLVMWLAALDTHVSNLAAVGAVAAPERVHTQGEGIVGWVWVESIVGTEADRDVVI